MIPVPESQDSIFEDFCGEVFAEGMHRFVHHVNGFPNLVMKISKDDNTFANWCEYLVSSALHGRPEPAAKLVGEVKSISATGKYLIMERLDDVSGSLSGIKYPAWLNDRKPSAFGRTTLGEVKVRDYGMLRLDDVLAGWNIRFDEQPQARLFPNGFDQDYTALLGERIGTDNGRSVHKVKGHADYVIKVCTLSHRSNRIEFLVHWALSDMNADEYQFFGTLECSRTGKYLVMERLQDLPPNFAGSKPKFPWWLVDTSNARLGVTASGCVKIRSYSEIRLGDVLMRAKLHTFQ
ncbi:hypothetical protein [Candidatus Ferrigenium straubiae]|jgi:hypothetical protein|uniref:hypothetical protein n=1 Tax=Candidatus Ferrigenium straubiae TaxID=2919506 RepID=UPI003F4A935A